MVQGTASSVGKSVLVAALCRIFRQDGYKVAPFKSQNMSLNSFVTKGGGEIGRAQAVQAEACGIEATVDMNPVLLKPEADSKSQVIVLGKVAKTLKASEYYKYTPHLLGIIEDSLNRLRSEYDIVVIEGAGSPAEINLKEREIVNMRIARMASSPVLMVGDIDRGGVFASIIGTLMLLTEEERGLVKGLVINKFRGDISLLKPGVDMLEKLAEKPVLGVIPFFRDIKIAQEDSVYLDERASVSIGQGLDVVVVRLPHISNYDDFDPLEEMGCSVRYINGIEELGHPDLIILPGTKSTIADLVHLKSRGIAQAIIKQAGSGIPVIGICGGYQMLGKAVNDPLHAESQETGIAGLGLLDIETTFSENKTTTQIKARVDAGNGLFEGLNGIEVTGYEIHMGQSESAQAAFHVIETPGGKDNYADGAVNNSGFVFGSYIHGLFHNETFTSALLNRLRKIRGLPEAVTALSTKDSQYDELAKLVRQNLDMEKIYNLVR